MNLYLDEAASIASTDLMGELLSKGRGFGLSVTMALQFPKQLRAESEAAYDELLGDVGTIISGKVTVSDKLATRYATDEMPVDSVRTRFSHMQSGRWFVSLSELYGETPPRPFYVESAPLPHGHPESDQPLTGETRAAYQDARTAMRERVTDAYAIDATVTAKEKQRRQSEQLSADVRGPVDSLLPNAIEDTPGVMYDLAGEVIRCSVCTTAYGSDTSALKDALHCCDVPAEVTREDLSVCEIRLTLSEAERRATGYSDRQLMFLQTVYGVQQGWFDTDAYDITRDSMTQLEAAVGISREAIDELRADDLLRKDTEHPHRLYTVTPDGRDVAGIAHPRGVAHGPGEGDLSESSLHTLMVELGTAYLEATHVADPDSPATVVEQYYSVADGRLDAAAVTPDDEIVATLEAERINNDIAEAVPSDYDKMAACEPATALWVVPRRKDAAAVVAALHDPADGQPRVSTTYSPKTDPSRYHIDQPGLTEVATITHLQNRLADGE